MTGAFAGLLPARRLPLLVLLALAAAFLWLPAADPTHAQDNGTPQVTAGPVITSAPASADTYGAGETITVAVTFSEAVAVTGEPRVRLEVGERKRWARYSGADGATLTFAYTVKGNDRDDDGISIPKNAVKLNGGSIADADANAAALSHPALPAQSGHKVNGSQQEPQPQKKEPTPTPTPTPTPEPEPPATPEPPPSPPGQLSSAAPPAATPTARTKPSSPPSHSARP